MDLILTEFQQVDLADSFFQSLKEDYSEFEAWFAKKAQNKAYLHRQPNGTLDGFLYLKVEDGPVDDVEPKLPVAKRLKVGTFKIDAHGTKLGDRFIKKIFDHAVFNGVSEIYVTVFEKHAPLILLLERYGFQKSGTKTSTNGTELVLTRSMQWAGSDRLKNFPLINLRGARTFVLGIWPKYHLQLFPDSILLNEQADMIQDLSHTNSINKIYLANMQGLSSLKPGDVVVIYRTKDDQGPAYYRSVATSLCVIEKVQNIKEFTTEEEFVKYCRPFSVFTDPELRKLYQTKRYPVLLRFTFNASLRKRPNMKELMEEIGLQSDYWGFFEISHDQFKAIAKWGEISESTIVDQA